MTPATAHSISRAPSPAVAVRMDSLTRYLMVIGSPRDYLRGEPAARRMAVLPRMFGPDGH
ncbi:hypothetical protein [Bradyrhizobium stylosanthis]|uniref:hypothetical protein n=1 Tax=Bradyrhizobium stylosanthis TaxID=1803665 RepID=UPI000B2553CE|nr:hypothetical protein [Bradyrhizobium stylosanthis]